MFDSYTTRGRVRNILKLLSADRKIILKGPLSELNRIAMRLTKLVEGLASEKTALTAVDLEAIRLEVDRNKTLLKASLSGTNAARALLSEQHRAATTMGTYTNSGERLEAHQKSDGTDWMA